MGGFTSLEICAGPGGQALGLERAGFSPVLLFDTDAQACETLRRNRPEWDVLCADLFEFVAHDHPDVLDVDLLSGGVPRPTTVVRTRPWKDTIEPLQAAAWLALEVRPRAVLLETLPTVAEHREHAAIRKSVEADLEHAGYECEWRTLDAQDFGVPQRREHGVLVALRPEDAAHFGWPTSIGRALTVGEALGASMAARGWPYVDAWKRRAVEVAPPIVGGARGRGGADLGPSRSKNIWARLGVNGGSLGDEPPGPDFGFPTDEEEPDRRSLPKLTVSQVSLLQGFPQDWQTVGSKTSRYRQIAQAIPPPLARALGESIARALRR